MNAEPIRPHQGKELPSNLGLTQRLWWHTYYVSHYIATRYS
jgi:hypothetical protein